MPGTGCSACPLRQGLLHPLYDHAEPLAGCMAYMQKCGVVMHPSQLSDSFAGRLSMQMQVQ